MAEVRQPVSRATNLNLYVRLSAMMFLQFAVWGAWSVMIAAHMQDNLKFTGFQLAMVFGTTAFGAIASPLLTGWIADRIAPAQWVTAVCHLVGAVLLFLAWRMTTFGGLWTLMFLYAMTYMPTIALTNGIAFQHMGDSDKFGYIRVWGTVGWLIVQLLILPLYLTYWQNVAAAGGAMAPGFLPDWGNALLAGRSGDCLLIASLLALIMGFYSFTLPHTPPSTEAPEPLAFLDAFRLFRDRNFAVLMIISFLVAIELPWYYNLTLLFFKEADLPGLYLGGLSLTDARAQAWMTLAQFSELFFMFSLFWMIRRVGMKMTIFLGILAWPVRYIIFAVGEPNELVIGSQALHGAAYTFFFAAGMVAVERLAHKDIRASAQSLLILATNGFGMLIGHWVSGPIHDAYLVAGEGATAVHNWAKIFALPIIITSAAAIAWLLFFDQARYRETAAINEMDDAAVESPDAAETAVEDHPVRPR